MDSFREELLQVSAILIAAIFFIIILTLNWTGYWVKKKVSERNPEKDFSLGAAEGSLMGLMGLYLAFTFGMATTKFEARRQIIIEEANLINTAILRNDLFPDSIKQTLLPDFKNYLDARINYFDAGDDPVKIKTTLEDANKHFNKIWDKTTQLTNDQANRSRAEQMAPVLISMNNMVTSRESGRSSTVPSLIIMVLLILVCISSFITGFGTKPGQRSPMFSFSFALMLAIALYLIMELGRPRQGYINLRSAEQNLVELRKSLS